MILVLVNVRLKWTGETTLPLIKCPIWLVLILVTPNLVRIRPQPVRVLPILLHSLVEESPNKIRFPPMRLFLLIKILLMNFLIPGPILINRIVRILVIHDRVILTSAVISPIISAPLPSLDPPLRSWP